EAGGRRIGGVLPRPLPGQPVRRRPAPRARLPPGRGQREDPAAVGARSRAWTESERAAPEDAPHHPAAPGVGPALPGGEGMGGGGGDPVTTPHGDEGATPCA